MGQCMSIPTKADAGVDFSLPTKAGYINWRLPLSIQLTNIAPTGGLRTVIIYGTDANFQTSFYLSFDVMYKPAV